MIKYLQSNQRLYIDGSPRGISPMPTLHDLNIEAADEETKQDIFDEIAISPAYAKLMAKEAMIEELLEDVDTEKKFMLSTESQEYKEIFAKYS